MHIIRSNAISQTYPSTLAPEETPPGADCQDRAPALTRREIECLQWLARGCYDAQIAQALRVSHSTVRLHLTNARRKLAARTREQALVKAVYLGVIEP